MRVEQKVLNRGLHCEGPGLCKYQSRLKFFLKWRKKNFYWLKNWRKFTYMWYVYSLDQCSKACLPGRKAMATPSTWLLYLLFFPWYQGPGHFVNVSVNLKNVPIYYIGLSFAKVLLKPWRKTAFIWRLGGLNCGLAKTSLQEVSIYCSLGVEVSELADEGEQGPKTLCKNIEFECAATTEKLRWLICPRSFSILAWCTAKVKHGYGESLAKENFLFGEDVLFRVKEFRTTLIYIYILFAGKH